MGEQEQLPVCALCGHEPVESDDGSAVFCADVDCEMLGVWLTVDAWRRLMARPRLAPEHVAPAAEGPGDDKIPEGAHLFYVGKPLTRPWPDPDPAALDTPEFNAVWQCIKDWDIAVPSAYHGYCGATGNHVRAILDALASIRAALAALGEEGK